MTVAQQLVSRTLPGGQALIGCIAKRAYSLEAGNQTPRALDELAPIVTEIIYDRPDGDDETAELLHEPDELVFGRGGVDVLVRGHVFAPREGATRLDVSVSVGPATKRLRVHGERTVERDLSGRLSFTEPHPFLTLPLTYRRAYGGPARGLPGEAPFSYPRNRIGTGFEVGPSDEVLIGRRVPNFEDPGDPVTANRLLQPEEDDWIDAPVAAGLGPIGPLTFPRSALLFPLAFRASRPVVELHRGDITSRDLEDRHPFSRPTDPRAFSCASSGLRNLSIDASAPIALSQLHPDAPEAHSRLPGASVSVEITPPGCRPQLVPATLRTVDLSPHARRMTVTYAAAIPVAAVFPPEALAQVRARVRWDGR